MYKEQHTSYIDNISDFNTLYKYCREIFKHNLHNELKGEILYTAWKKLFSVSKDAANEVISDWLQGKESRYNEFIRPTLKNIESGTFLMGTNNDSHIKYCGEVPKHKVELSTFLIGITQVTNQLFSIYKPSHSFSNGLFKPVTNISWYDAKMFCMWFDCRLLTEAEWEYASCKKENTFWCCTEDKLNDFAWYSENSEGEIHDVAQLQANNFDLFDMHGNVWEWVNDSYDENYYSNASLLNPENSNSMKVCRGGSIHGFSEMCRSSFRYYEPSYYSAPDLGFRIAKS